MTASKERQMRNLAQRISEAEATIEALLFGQSDWHIIRDGVRRLSV